MFAVSEGVHQVHVVRLQRLHAGLHHRVGLCVEVRSLQDDEVGPLEVEELIPNLERNVDLFLCEATLAGPESDSPERGHLTADEALAAADGPVLLTHRPAELPPPDGMPLAEDGLVVEVEPLKR